MCTEEIKMIFLFLQFRVIVYQKWYGNDQFNDFMNRMRFEQTPWMVHKIEGVFERTIFLLILNQKTINITLMIIIIYPV